VAVHEYTAIQQSRIFLLGTAVTSSFFGPGGIFVCLTTIILHSLNTHLSEA